MSETETRTGHFNDLGIAQNLLAILKEKGFETPTPIQHQVIPGALEGKDVIGVAQTGTGKTFAFGIPMIQRLMLGKKQGLILVPTRELAEQVDKSLRQIGNSLGFRSAVIMGGVPQSRQVRDLRRDPHIVIATPGRLDDLMRQKLYKLDKVQVITLDEADRMLDIGFLHQIKRILQNCPPEKQTLLFSATMPKSIAALASEFMKLPLRIEIAPQGTSAENVEQEIFVTTTGTKMKLLESILQEYKNDTILIFSRTKHGATRIAREIRNLGHTATEIHSGRSQSQRRGALAGFVRGDHRIMVATDIAARGIDVEKISLVINFDLPESTDDYVHRIGRTGRAGRYGKAISFVTASQRHNVRRIEQLIQKSLPLLFHPSLPKESLGPEESPRSFQPNRNRFSNRRRSNSGGSGGSYGNRGYASGGQRSPRGRNSGQRNRNSRQSF